MLKKFFNTYDSYVTQENIINSINNIDNVFLNNYPIYVINLKSDTTRRNYIKYVFEKHKINYKLIIVDKFNFSSYEEQLIYFMPHARMGCILSHTWCINNAINNNYEKFIIFEDDIIFHKQFNTLFENIIKDTKELPDLLMLGALDFNIKEHIVNTNENKNIYFPMKKNILGAHANLYSLNFAKSFLEYKLNDCKVREFDYDYCVFYNKYKIGVCIPNLIICELSTSNINHNFTPMDNKFDRYKMSFLDNFTYNDYEYLIIVFIDFIKDAYKNNIEVSSMEKALELFNEEHANKSNISNIIEWINNSNYMLDNINKIINYITSDKIK